MVCWTFGADPVWLKLVKQPLLPGRSQAFTEALQCHQRLHILLLARAETIPPVLSTQGCSGVTKRASGGASWPVLPLQSWISRMLGSRGPVCKGRCWCARPYHPCRCLVLVFFLLQDQLSSEMSPQVWIISYAHAHLVHEWHRAAENFIAISAAWNCLLKLNCAFSSSFNTWIQWPLSSFSEWAAEGFKLILFHWKIVGWLIFFFFLAT